MSLRRNRGLIRQGPPGLLYPGGSLISPRSGNRLWRYTACEISVADPGAVPGASTSFAPAGPAIRGGELGSTRVVKVRSVARYDSVVIGSESSCERQLRTRGARGLTPSGVKALSKSRFEGHRATEAPHSPIDPALPTHEPPEWPRTSLTTPRWSRPHYAALCARRWRAPRDRDCPAITTFTSAFVPAIPASRCRSICLPNTPAR